MSLYPTKYRKRRRSSVNTPGWKVPWESFVGRQPEKQVLFAAIDASANTFSLTVIAGPGGIGKSCLVTQALAYAAQRGILALSSGCSLTEPSTSYGPFVEIIRQYLGALNEDSRLAHPLLHNFVDRCPNVCGNPPHSQLADEAVESRLVLFRSVASFFNFASGSMPAFLVIEDVHRIDSDSLALLDNIFPALRSCRIALVLTCREAELSPAQRSVVFPNHLSGLNQRILRLAPLTEPEVGAYLSTLTPPEEKSELSELAQMLTQRGEGNPLLIRQLLQALVENSSFLRQTSFPPKKPSSTHRTGSDLRETFRVRIAKLSFECRRVLENAAILGEESEAALLKLMAGEAATDFEQALTEAVEAGMLRLFRAAREGRYRFSHDVIYNIIYSAIHIEERRRLHGRAAECIARFYTSDLSSQFGRLAQHYEQADSASNLSRALQYWIKAGEVQFSLTAFAKAKSHWKSARSLAERINADVQLRARVCEYLAEVELLSSTRASKAIFYLREALQLIQLVGNGEEAGRIHARLATMLLLSTSSQNVILASVHNRTADNLLNSAGGESASYDLELSGAFVAHSTLATKDGLACSERAMKIAERLSSPEKWCQAASLQALFLWAQGDLDGADQLFKQAYEQAETFPSAPAGFATALARGYSSLTLWDPSLASSQFRAGIARDVGGQVPLSERILLANAGIAYCLSGHLAKASNILSDHPHRFLQALINLYEGNWSAAEDLLVDELSSAQRTQNKHLEWAYSWWLGRLCRMKEQFDRAEQYLLSSPVLKHGIERIPEEIGTRAELGLLYVQAENVNGAMAQLAVCEELMSGPTGWRGLAGQVECVQALIYNLNGDSARGELALSQARTTLRKYCLPFEEAEAVVTFGSSYLRRGALGRGVNLLTEAQKIYRQVGAAGSWTTRVESLLADRPSDGSFSTIGPRMSDTVSTQPAVGKYSALYSLAQEATDKMGSRPQDAIYEYASVKDVALIATFIHDAIAHLMSAINKAAGWKDALDRIADSIDLLASRTRVPQERTRSATQRKRMRQRVLSSSAGNKADRSIPN